MKRNLTLKISGILVISWTLLLLTLPSLEANAQTDSTKTADSTKIKSTKKTNKTDLYRKNAVKINLGAAIALKSYNFSYERMLSRKISFVAGYNTMPENKISGIPLLKKLTDQADDQVKNDIDRISVSNTAYTGEFRFYMGHQSGARGTYIALYGRYVDTKINYQYQFEASNRTYDIPLKSDLKGFGGGILIGTQYIISKRIVIDIYAGGHYGKTKGDADGLVDLSTMTAADKIALKSDLESTTNIRDKQYLTATVSDDGVHGKVSGPLIGLRAGFSLGIAF